MIFLREKIAVPAAFLCAATASTLAAPDVPAKEIPPEGIAENVEEISPESTEKFSGARTEYFELSSDSPTAVKQAAELAREVETYFVRNPRLWKVLLPPAGFRVRAELFSQPGIFRLSKNEDNFVTLFLSVDFSEAAARDAIRLRLAQAMIFNLVPGKNPTDVPAWIAFAVAEESRIGSMPGRRIFLQKKSRQTPVLPPLSILGATGTALSRDDSLRTNALWLLRASPNVFHFLDTEKTDEEKFAAAFPQIFPEGKYEEHAARKFWNARFHRLVAAAPSGIDLPEESQRVFDNALLFLIEKDGDEARVLASDLVEFRLNEDIRRLVSEKLSEFSAHFRKVNPVWHNAFAEYGLFLEMFGNPDVDNETLAAQWDKAVLARNDALTLSRDLRRALDSAK